MLASGDVPVRYGMLSGGFAGTDQTVAMMQGLATGQWGSRSPKIRALAINIIRQANIPDKDYTGEMVAIHNWVRDQMRYTRDVAGQETLCPPEEVAFNSHAGDCLDENTRLLTQTGYKAIKDIRKGDIIQGKKGWTKVLATWDKGTLPVKTYFLDNGGDFTATADHRCFRLDGSEVLANDLKIRDALLGPSMVDPCGPSDRLSPQDCFFIGIYLADGWTDGNMVCIAGKDGFAKETQKRWVQDYAAGKGWKTSWHPRYIRVYIPKDAWMNRLFSSGAIAPEEKIPDEVWSCLNPENVERLLKGLMSDSHTPMETKRALGAVASRKKVRRSGTGYSTVSPELAKQVRTLFRFTGVSVSISKVVDHGGLGTNPVYRIYPRYYLPKPARLEEVVEVGSRHVYDIKTEDKGIYLPDADVVVHNCDDLAMLDAALLGSIGIPSRFVTIGVTPDSFSHVYLEARPKGKWIALDPIMKDKPAGWEAGPSVAKIRKVYSENIPQDTPMRSINGLGYVGDPRVFSHLDAEPAAEPTPSGYVVMDSMLDADAPIEQISRNMPAFPQQTYNSMNKPQARVMRTVVQNMSQKAGVRVADQVAADNRSLAESEAAAMNPMHGLNGINGLMGPDVLSDIAFNPDVQGSGSRMQRPALAQAPEGVDSMFTRPNMVLRPDRGDRVIYRGLYALNERPPIRPVTNVSGLGEEALPYTPADTAIPAAPSKLPKMAGIALLALGVYLYFKK